MEGYTIFSTYMLANTGTTNTYGYSDALHCAYVRQVKIDNTSNKEINLYFENEDEFKFLSNSGGTGYCANVIYMIIQMVDNTQFENEEDIKPKSDGWKIFDVTEDINNHTIGDLITVENLTNSVLGVRVDDYLKSTNFYNLDYLSYPSNTDDVTLNFGDETYFLGNVKSNVEAIAYTTDLSINLPLTEFLTSTNATWNGGDVYISEIGLYDSNKNLVAIGKLNNPISKNESISRTIVFGIDF